MSRTFPVSIRTASAAAHAAALGVMGLLTKPSFRISNMFGPTERSKRALIGSVDSRSVIELALVHRLASPLWRLRRANAIETGLLNFRVKLCPRAGRTRPAGAVNRERPARGPMGIAKSLARTDETIRG
jgi:hypothetical protein